MKKTNYESIKTGEDDTEDILKENRKPHLRQVIGRHKSWKKGLEKNLNKQKMRGFQFQK